MCRHQPPSLTYQTLDYVRVLPPCPKPLLAQLLSRLRLGKMRKKNLGHKLDLHSVPSLLSFRKRREAVPTVHSASWPGLGQMCCFRSSQLRKDPKVLSSNHMWHEPFGHLNSGSFCQNTNSQPVISEFQYSKGLDVMLWCSGFVWDFHQATNTSPVETLLETGPAGEDCFSSDC